MTTRRTFPLWAAALLLAGFIAAFIAAPIVGPQRARAQTPAASPAIVAPGADSLIGCPNCHGDPAIQQKGDKLYVPESELAASVHGQISCVGCHLEIQGIPHKNPQAELDAALSSCGTCHKQQLADWSAGTHSKAPNGPTCFTCHGGHDVQPADTRAFIIEAANDKCSNCHTERGESFFDRNYHGKESSLGRSDVAVCADCHGPHEVLPASDPASTVSERNVRATCAKCHPGANDNFASIEIHVQGKPIPADPKLGLITVWFIIILSGTFGLFGYHMILGIRHEWRRREARESGG